MKYFTGPSGDHNEDELQRISALMRASAYFDRREQQILQSQQATIGLQRAIRDVMADIAHLLVAKPSAGNQAMLERGFGELKGLVNAVAQTGTVGLSGADSGASRGADVDLTGTKAAIGARANSPSGNALKDADKRGNKATRTKDLPALDAVLATKADQNAPSTTATTAPGDDQPAADTPASNLDRVNKLAPVESRTQDDPALSAASDRPLPPNKRGSRSNVAALKLDHAEAVAKSDAPDGQIAGHGIDPTAKRKRDRAASSHAAL